MAEYELPQTDATALWRDARCVRDADNVILRENYEGSESARFLYTSSERSTGRLDV